MTCTCSLISSTTATVNYKQAVHGVRCLRSEAICVNLDASCLFNSISLTGSLLDTLRHRVKMVLLSSLFSAEKDDNH